MEWIRKAFKIGRSPTQDYEKLSQISQSLDDVLDEGNSNVIIDGFNLEKSEDTIPSEPKRDHQQDSELYHKRDYNQDQEIVFYNETNQAEIPVGSLLFQSTMYDSKDTCDIFYFHTQSMVTHCSKINDPFNSVGTINQAYVLG